ncbi:hypothetical protein [Leucobacter sp. G161]|uniref:hypothetical protein n=1 Tax=Leucobacter sp. G161 TaxID=663704 RepID=UPI00073BD7BE|nr:hypothetical protein [Leucobacter sp. G161]KUF05677.1 hypothetical protein AUL38_15900 [Leucobacter sp. G161]
MTRNRASAKKAGTAQETLAANYLARVLNDDRIERRRLGGSKDRGDIAGLRTVDQLRIVAEVKNTAKLALGPWLKEAEIERGNDDAAVGVVIHKRHGSANPEDQIVSMTLRDFAVLLGGDVNQTGEGS